MSTMSREELRNIAMVEAFAAAEAKKSQLQCQKSNALLCDVECGKHHSSCAEAPCFVATEDDLMNLTEYLNRLAPAVIEAGIIKITVPEELRAKLLPCTKPSCVEFPCKVQVMRCSSRHEELGSANLVGHHFGHSATTTLEKLKRRTRRMKASFGIQEHDVLTPQAMDAEFWKWVQRGSKNKSSVKGMYASDIEFNASRNWKCGSLESLSNHRESLLRHDLIGKISGVNTSMIYVGTAFSFFPWHYEDNMLYSLNYHHEGDSKTWYGISNADAPQFENITSKNLFPEISGKEPHHVWAKSSLIEPSVLIRRGVKIVSCVQNAGDFVLTSPGGYHQGFCHGYCFAEALNWAPLSWFPYAMAAAKFYREIAFPAAVISMDQLLLSCARELVSESSNIPLLSTVGTSSLALLRSLHSHVQALSQLGISIRNIQPHSNSDQHLAIRCDYCQHLCHVAHASIRDPQDSSKVGVCCLDHLIYHHSAWDIDLKDVCIHLREDLGEIVHVVDALNQRLSTAPSCSVPALVRPFPIVEVVDEFILQKNKSMVKTARSRDSRVSDISQELQDDPCSILPSSFQHRPFSIALRLNHLRQFRAELPHFFEGSSSMEKMQDFDQLDNDDGTLKYKRDRDEFCTEKSIERDDSSISCIHVPSIPNPASCACTEGRLSRGLGLPHGVATISCTQIDAHIPCSSLLSNRIMGSVKKSTKTGLLNDGESAFIARLLRNSGQSRQQNEENS